MRARVVRAISLFRDCAEARWEIRRQGVIGVIRQGFETHNRGEASSVSVSRASCSRVPVRHQYQHKPSRIIRLHYTSMAVRDYRRTSSQLEDSRRPLRTSTVCVYIR
jgi:hypothetical protein